MRKRRKSGREGKRSDVEAADNFYRSLSIIVTITGLVVVVVLLGVGGAPASNVISSCGQHTRSKRRQTDRPKRKERTSRKTRLVPGNQTHKEENCFAVHNEEE